MENTTDTIMNKIYGDEEIKMRVRPGKLFRINQKRLEYLHIMRRSRIKAYFFNNAEFILINKVIKESKNINLTTRMNETIFEFIFLLPIEKKVEWMVNKHVTIEGKKYCFYFMDPKNCRLKGKYFNKHYGITSCGYFSPKIVNSLNRYQDLFTKEINNLEGEYDLKYLMSEVPLTGSNPNITNAFQKQKNVKTGFQY